MKKILTTTTLLLLFAAWPLLAQESPGAGAGIGDNPAGAEGAVPSGVSPTTGLDEGADAETTPTVQQDDAARTEVPAVSGAETTPQATPAQQAAGTPPADIDAPAGVAGADTKTDATPGVAGAETDIDVTERARYETERTATTGLDEDEGGVMPTTASALPALIGLGAAFLLAGLGLRAASRQS